MVSTYNSTRKLSKCLTFSITVDVNSLYEHDHIEVFLQEGWREGLCKCEKVPKAIIMFLMNN